MNFKDLNLSKSYLTDTKTFIYTDKNNVQHEVTVNKHISTRDKYDLFETAFQKAQVNGKYQELLLDVFFHLNIVYLYTDIEFSDEDRLDELELFDILEQNGIIDKVVYILTEDDEYNNLKELFVQQLERNIKYNGSAAAVLRTLTLDLPRNAEAAKKIVDGFNADDYKNVVEFAQMANMGRPIPNAAPIE